MSHQGVSSDFKVTKYNSLTGETSESKKPFSFDDDQEFAREFDGFSEEGKIINGVVVETEKTGHLLLNFEAVVDLSLVNGSLQQLPIVVNGLQTGASITKGPDFGNKFLGRVMAYNNHWKYSSQYDLISAFFGRS